MLTIGRSLTTGLGKTQPTASKFETYSPKVSYAGFTVLAFKTLLYNPGLHQWNVPLKFLPQFLKVRGYLEPVHCLAN